MTNDHDPPGPLGEAGARLRAIRDRVQSIQGCVNRTCCTCVICDRQLFTVLQDLDALLSAPVVSPPQDDKAKLLAEWEAEVAEHGLWTSGHCIAERMAKLLAASAPVVTQEGE
jgi:hypothetical protein